uniref:Uncharacterized protein n=1 Tax=Tetranychus urticae TaxID=32264 RepID=T1KCI4_TETUR
MAINKGLHIISHVYLVNLGENPKGY